jgi:hypothetical protein
MFFRKNKVLQLPNWPQPSAGATQPVISADDSSLTVHYRTENGQIARIHFPLCDYFQFGAPNDEALHGHPLMKNGLEHYTVHEVLNSSLIHTLEVRNSVHPMHNRVRFLEGKRHLVFTFHDSTLECVIEDVEGFRPEVSYADA